MEGSREPLNRTPGQHTSTLPKTAPQSVDHPYPFPLTTSRHSAILHAQKLYDANSRSPWGVKMPRKRRHSVSSSGKVNSRGRVSESMAMQQRKIRDTEARIDHALDLVTRSFGVTDQTDISRSRGPRAPEFRRIRETLAKTQRVSSDEPNDSDRISNQMTSSAMRAYKSPMLVLKRRNHSNARAKIYTSPQQPQQSVRVYKTNPIPSQYFPAVPKKQESQKELNRSQIVSICVIQGNTHIYQKTNPDFINSFANVETFRAIDDSNPAGLPRFRTKIDMNGFLDNEITFQAEGKKVTIFGNRPRKNICNERKVIEIVELPPGVFPEKLRIARDKDGVLHLEERWTIIN